MNLADTATTLKAIIEGHGFFAGVPVLIEDGLTDHDKAMHDALDTTGVFFVIQRAQGSTQTGSSRSLLQEAVELPVTLTELPQVNRTETGFNQTPERINDQFKAAILKHNAALPGRQQNFSFEEMPFRLHGVDDKGREVWLFNLLAHTTTEPAA